MNKNQILLTLLCVVMIASGQILFKKSGIEIRNSETWFTFKNFLLLSFAFAIYASATFLWIDLLKAIPLSRAYVFMSLSFVIVPLASVIFFHEKLSFLYIIGAAFIVFGIILASQAS